MSENLDGFFTEKNVLVLIHDFMQVYAKKMISLYIFQLFWGGQLFSPDSCTADLKCKNVPKILKAKF